MGIQGKINKLLMALRLKGYIYKIDQRQFYIEDKDKMCTKYILYMKSPKNGEEFYSKVKMLKYLAERYKEVGVSNG